jgi:RNA polymerase sigma-70 factor, ECF subfamily
VVDAFFRAAGGGDFNALVTVKGRPYAVLGFTVAEGKILEIDAIADPERVQRIATAVLRDKLAIR